MTVQATLICSAAVRVAVTTGSTCTLTTTTAVGVAGVVRGVSVMLVDQALSPMALTARIWKS